MNEGIDLKENMLNGMANPDQMYGWEKLTITKLMEYSPVDCRVGILHTIYGPKQAFEGVKAKFPPQIAYKAFLAQKTGKLEVWGDGTQTRTFLYINDALEKMYEVMMKRTYYGPVNIGSDKEVSVDEVVKVCCDILKIKPKIVHNTKKPTGPVRRRCSNFKFNKHYKTREKTSLKKGFRQLIKYIKLCQKSKHR
jgi:nucleoside-diphosphate-sugar epimerase